jgi:hypothetical protein
VGVRGFDADDGCTAFFKDRPGLLLESMQHLAGIAFRSGESRATQQDSPGDEGERPPLRN